MMRPTVGMSERKHKPGCGQFASEPDDNTVDRPVTLHFDPVSAAPNDIRTIRRFATTPSTLGKSATPARVALVRLIDQLQTRIVALEQARELASTDCQWLSH